VFDGMDTFVTNDSESSLISDAVSIELGDDPRTYSKEAIESSDLDEFSWSIVCLVKFCEERELRVPEAWQAWMSESLPVLNRFKLRDATYDPVPN
jgi:hypothetical protein